VTSETRKALLEVDPDEGRIIRTMDTGQETSHMVAVTPDGRRAFVANIRSGSVTALDLEKGIRLAIIPTGSGAEGIAVTPDGREVWVTNRDADTVSVIDTGSLRILKTLPSLSFPIRAKATPDGRHVLVSNARSGEVAVFNADSLEEEHRISLDLKAHQTRGRLFGSRFGDSSVPIGILILPDGVHAYVAHANADLISIVDLTHWKTAGFLTAGKEPDGMGYSALEVASPSRS
ncbi:MAG: YncE family protein, partial [Acidobacteriota bacterium]